jgi:pantothenate kinase
MRCSVIIWLPLRYVRRWYKIGEQRESDSAADKRNNHDVRTAQSTNNTSIIIIIIIIIIIKVK